MYSFSVNAILETVSRFLEEKDLQFAANADGETLLLPCSGEHLQWNTTVNVSDQGNCLSFISRLPSKIPQVRRSAAAEMIARINFGRRLGAFHLDMSDGEVLYCVSQVLDEEMISNEVLEMLLGVSYISMDTSGTEIMRMVFNKSEAGEDDKSAKDPKRIPTAWN